MAIATTRGCAGSLRCGHPGRRAGAGGGGGGPAAERFLRPASVAWLSAAVLRGARADGVSCARQPLSRALAFRRPGRSGKRLAARARAAERLAQPRARTLAWVGTARSRRCARPERAARDARSGGGDLVVGIETRRAG